MDMQALIDGMSARWQKERAENQLTLGGMIEALEVMPKDTKIRGLGPLASYRGYYCDLSFGYSAETETASALLERCKDAMGKIFEGYKGGDFVMGALTPLWLSDYGSCGDKIMGINADGTIQTAKDDTAD